MLSRTADSLFWASRYMERAENTARVLDVAYRVSLAPGADAEAHGEWASVLAICGCEERFAERHDGVSKRSVIEFMALDPDNPSSIYSSIRIARENARAERNNLTTDIWEALNATWLEIRDMDYAVLAAYGFQKFFDWVKERSHLIRGATMATMLRDDTFNFTRLGTFIERADNTARILDGKYHILLPQTEAVGGAVDYYQWAALLRSVSAFRIYRRIYRDAVLPWRVAELMILHGDMPRSLHFCLREITANLDMLAEIYGERHECHRLAGELHAWLRYGKVEQVFQEGLHEFLTDFIARNNRLAVEIGRNFLMTV